MMILVYQLDSLTKIYRYIVLDIIIIASILYTGQYIEAGIDINHLRNVWKERENQIEEIKKNGEDKIELVPYYPTNSKNPSYGLEDIGPNSNQWPNNSIAEYYNLKEVSQKKE